MPTELERLREENGYLKDAIVLAQVQAALRDRSHNERVQSLLEHNNRLLARARTAEAVVNQLLAGLPPAIDEEVAQL